MRISIAHYVDARTPSGVDKALKFFKDKGYYWWTGEEIGGDETEYPESYKDRRYLVLDTARKELSYRDSSWDKTEYNKYTDDLVKFYELGQRELLEMELYASAEAQAKLVESDRIIAVKQDSSKPDLSLLSYPAMIELVRAMQVGVEKYGRDNYRSGFNTNRLIAAALRHIFKWQSGEDTDSETGVSHLGHAMANLMMLLDNLNQGTAEDGRWK